MELNYEYTLNTNTIMLLSDAHRQSEKILAIIKASWDIDYNDYLISKKISIPQSLVLMRAKNYLGEFLTTTFDKELISSKPELNVEFMFITKMLLCREIIKKVAKILDLDLEEKKDKIIRSIQFPPELKQSGISILNYFSHILNHKYPLINVGVTIEQNENRVTLIIDTPDGKKEIIEKELADYGLVVVGQIPPEQFISDENEILLLKYKLEMTQMETRHTKEILNQERLSNRERIKRLENDVTYFKNFFDKDRNLIYELSQQVLELAKSSSQTVLVSLNNISDILKKGEIENERELIEHFMNIRKEDNSTFNNLNEILIKGSLQGTAGNYLYSFLTNTLPKFF